jgi:hypothetical protein
MGHRSSLRAAMNRTDAWAGIAPYLSLWNSPDATVEELRELLEADGIHKRQWPAIEAEWRENGKLR